RGDVEMRSQPAIRIDLMRGKGEHRTLNFRFGESFKRGKEEPRGAGHRLDVRGGCDDEQNAAALRSDSSKERLGRCRQTRNTGRGQTKPKAAGCRLQERAKRQRTGGIRRHSEGIPESSNLVL